MSTEPSALCVSLYVRRRVRDLLTCSKLLLLQPTVGRWCVSGGCRDRVAAMRPNVPTGRSLPSNADELLACLISAAQHGGEALSDCFGRALDAQEKSHPSDLRTSADTASERAILEVLERTQPQLAVYSEERGRVGSSPLVVVIDPLDGTSNFVLGVLNFSVSLALMCEEETLIGVVHQPVLRRTYWALKGRGAHRDSVRLRVNHESRIERAIVSYTSGYLTPAAQGEHVAHALTALGVKRFIRFWSPAYDFCLLASGKIEGVVNNGSELYDFAAGRLLVREAGGQLTDAASRPDTDANAYFVASNGTRLHDALLQVVGEMPQD